ARRGIVPRRRARPADAARSRAPQPGGARRAGRRHERAALDLGLEPVRRGARRGLRAAVRVRVALRAGCARCRARDLPREVSAVRRARAAVRDGRRQRRRRAERRGGAAAVHVRAAKLHESAPQRTRQAAAADRRHRSVLDADREGARREDARMLVRRFAVDGARRARTLPRAYGRGRADRGHRRLRSPRAPSFLRAARGARAGGLSDAMEIPPILYGTAWKKERTAALVAAALGAGFRGIDTACQPKHYDEAGVGDGVAAAGVARDELYLQTKFTPVDGHDSRRIPYDPAAPVAAQVRR